MADIQKLHSELTELLQSRTEEVRNALSKELRQKLEAALAVSHGAAQNDELNAVLESLQQFNSQAEILKAMLDGAGRFSVRCALFVVKGNTLTGWQGRGLAREEALKSTVLHSTDGLAGRVIRDRVPAAATAHEFDLGFIQQQGAPYDGNAWVFPLVVRDKVAAVLYCDAGSQAGKRLDASALQILVRSAGQWLEIIAARKAAGATDAPPSAVTFTPVTPPQTVPAPAGRVAVPGGFDHLPQEEKDLHTKAKRFAKLLVDEIKLYNQAKVNEGRQTRDIYNLLREDIEKSRETYNKRYANTSVSNAGYFSQEVIRILADNDAALLGSDFPE